MFGLFLSAFLPAAACNNPHKAPEGGATPVTNRIPDTADAESDDLQETRLKYLDPDTEKLFFVEEDGRHLVARNRYGKVLWRRNPFIDGKLKPHRVNEPIIVWVEPRTCSGKKELGIAFDSGQFGCVDMGTGDFQFLGQQ
jgi:hypothetical protein